MEKEKIQSLISQMTLEEIAGMCSGADFWHLKGVERLGIPSVMVTDGPHGLRKQAQGADHLGINESEKAICFPAGCATASSFDRELIRKQGELLGQECQAMDVSTILGPAMNIKRSPLCGRNFEYYSEDPLVSTEMAAALIKGVQSKNVGTSAKHFVANNQENEEMGTRKVPFGRELYIVRADFMIEPPKKYFRLYPGIEVRLMNAYFVTCTDYITDDDGNVTEIHCTYDPETKSGSGFTGRKVKGTIQWVCAETAERAEVRLYENIVDEEKGVYNEDGTINVNPNSLTILENCYVEPALAEAKPMDSFQFVRQGYFCVDSKDSTEDHLVFNRIVSLKSSYRPK